MRVPATFATLLVLAIPAKVEASKYPGGCNTRGCLKRSCKAACQERVRVKAARRHMRRVIAPFRDWLRNVRWCESTNNYRAVDPTGTYTGAYQFDNPTWRSVGGSTVRAMDASPLEQDYRAVLLLQRHGTSPWPVCG